MHRSASKNVPWTEASKRTVKGDRTANAVTMDLPSEGTSSLSEIRADMAPLRWILRKRNRDARFRTPSSEDTSSTSSIAPEFQPEVDGGEHGTLEDERCGDDGLFQERFSPAPSHLRPLQVSSTSYNWKKFEERGGSVCVERGCGPRMCLCAHHGNCSLLIDARSCDHPPRARRSDCASGDSSQCRQGEAQRNHCQRISS